MSATPSVARTSRKSSKWTCSSSTRTPLKSKMTARIGGIAGPSLSSDRLGTALAGADADAVVHRQDEDLAVANLPLGAGPASGNDGVDRGLDEVFVHGN